MLIDRQKNFPCVTTERNNSLQEAGENIVWAMVNSASMSAVPVVPFCQTFCIALYYTQYMRKKKIWACISP